MNLHEAADLLAPMMHEMWRTKMLAEGWRYGPAYDEAAKTHDALVPFEQLHPTDRVWTRTGLEDYAEILLREVEYPRGDDREFRPEEMRVGLPVVGSDLESKGTVQAWIATPDGCLESITVRWDDGEVTEHCPASGEVLRA
ncbi:hypothetical protein PHYC_03834 [Phycisphaerales bacterium]|nr:hypothetical protein PHYC_03834 [Phycisphaerales bacterium]